MKAAEVRQQFFKFFEEKGHTQVETAPLIPQDDPTLLFVNAGMVPFKSNFLDTGSSPYPKAVSCQKCLRISGKHNDLENVGRTKRHHTFFEMLGNFSFGDYFKEGAIEYGWEFLTEVLGLDKSRLWITIFEDDDEAGDLWNELAEVPREKIVKCGEKDNFWAMGETGPCGPCSEIHYYIGERPEDARPEDLAEGSEDFLEIWNLVFMQFNRDSSGALNPLPRPCVDTGMGLERIASVLQGVRANYDIDSFKDVILKIEDLSKHKYEGLDYQDKPLVKGEQYTTDVAMRVIADHVRAASFLIVDGVRPSSEGRGYVLRRLIRRAIRHGVNIDFPSGGFGELVQSLGNSQGEFYKELVEYCDQIKEIINTEEEKFRKTLDSGLETVQKAIEESIKRKSKFISGEIAFKLHDTYGFPLDLTEDIIASSGLEVDRVEFNEFMQEQKERSRSSRSSKSSLNIANIIQPAETQFYGYSHIELESDFTGLYLGNEAVSSIEAGKGGETVLVTTKETPFYGESGGQVGDTGFITTKTGVLEVEDTQKLYGNTWVHICQVKEGEISVDQKARLVVDEVRRGSIAKNHSCTHLLHQALRETLGNEVRQAGSRVHEFGLRFDFTLSRAPKDDELNQIQLRLNELISLNNSVEISQMPIDEAKGMGAMALFGEKYGDIVRVVKMGEGSVELCGGIHVESTGDIGTTFLVGESSISSDSRRIEFYTSSKASRAQVLSRNIVKELCGMTSSNEENLLVSVSSLIEKISSLEGKIRDFEKSSSENLAKDLVSSAIKSQKGFSVVGAVIDVKNPGNLRDIADAVRSRLGQACIGIIGKCNGKAYLLVNVSKGVDMNAKSILGEVSSVLGSKGGGSPMLAQAGGGNLEMADKAKERFLELVS